MKYIVIFTMFLTFCGVSFAEEAMEGDPVAGEKVYKKCKSCHAIEEGKKKTGPSLFAMYGQKAGQVEGFKYSKAMAGADIIWDDENLDKFLEKPKKFLKGTRMAFAGLKKEKDRKNVIAYIKTLTKE